MSVLLRKAICIIMCAVLMMPFAAMTVSAVSAGEPYIDRTVYTLLRYPVDETADARYESFVQQRRFGAASPPDANEPFTFYTLLDEREKEMYNSILACRAGLDSATKGVVDVVFNEHKFTNTNYNKLLLNVKSSLLFVLSALKEDHPELFFIWGYSDFTFGPSDYTLSGLRYTLNRFSFTVYYYDAAYKGWGAVEQYYDMLLDAVANFRVTGNTRYEKVKSIHDSICSQVTYDPNVNDEEKRNPMDFDPTSVFCEPYLTVCEGYSEAFKMICDRERIPCITVVGDGGGPHKWAYVKMEDGKWYGIDVTWDDQDGATMYDFFLCGSQTKNVFFDGQDFASLHVPTGEMFYNAKALTYPELSPTSYVGAICVPNTASTYDAQNMRMYISKDAVLTEQLVGSSEYAGHMPDDHTVSVFGETTGATVSVTTVNANDKNYTVIRRGDVDEDNSVDGTDYGQMRAVVEGTGEITGSTPGFYAADFNGDGVIDGFDLYYMDMCLNDNL